MTRDELIADRDRIQAEIDALPLSDAELVQELTRVQMDGENAVDEDASNYEDAFQNWRDVTASGVRAVLARLRELGWRAPTDPRQLPKGVSVDSLETFLAEGGANGNISWEDDARNVLSYLNINPNIKG